MSIKVRGNVSGETDSGSVSDGVEVIFSREIERRGHGGGSR